MPRVFSAVEIEDEKTLEKLKQVRNETGHGFRPVPEEKMHITLQFFKDIDQEEINEIKQVLHHTELQPFTAEIKGLSAFPSEDYIKVIWAGVEAEEMHKLKTQVSQHEVGAEEKEDFRPHITLHRVDSISPEEKEDLHKAFKKYRDEVITEITVEKVKLFESHVEEEGPSYEVLDEAELDG